MGTAGIVLAGGKGERVRRAGGPGEVLKQFREVGGRPLVWYALRLFDEAPEIDSTILVVPEDAVVPDVLRESPKPRLVVTGGESRAESVAAALRALPAGCEWVVVHDGARPIATAALVARVVAAAREHGAAVPVLPVRDTFKVVNDNFVARTVPREGLVAAQTPQAFRRDLLARAYAEGVSASDLDDCALVERLGHPVRAVEGDVRNIKVTFPDDFEVVSRLLAERG